MKKNYFKFLATACVLLSLNSLHAQFQGAFAPANWGTVAANSDGITNTSGAPNSIFMTSGDNQGGNSGTNDFSITIQQSGFITFNWSYTTPDGPSWDYPMVMVNGNASVVAGYNTGGSTSQSSVQPCIRVSQGDNFRFRMYSVDNYGGPATTVFSNFSLTVSNVTISPASPTVCPGSTIALTASGGTNYVWSGGISNGVAFTPTGSAVYSVTSGNGNCLFTNTVSLVYNPPLTITSSTNNICTGQSTTLTVNGATSYTWSNNLNTPTVAVAPGTTTGYSVVGTTTNGCNSSAFFTVNVFGGLPVLSINSSTNTTCNGKTVTLTASGALVYSWSGGVTNGVSFTPSVTQAYTVTGTNPCGSSTAATIVTITPLPVSVMSTPTIVCATNPATMIAVSSGTSYTWTPGPIPGATVVVNPSVTTIYTVSVTDGTCSGVAMLTLTALPIPTVNVVASATQVCEGGPVTMTVTGGQSYVWMPGGQTSSIVTFNPTGPTLYTITATNSLNCSASINQIVLTNPSPTVNANASTTLTCPGMPITITGSGADTYVWSNGPITAANTVSPMVTTSYTVVGTNNNNGCTNTKVYTINVFEATVGISASPTVVCSGQTSTLTGTGADAYNWTNGPGVNIVVVTPTVTSIYTLTAASNTINNLTCSTVKTVQVVVNALPNVTASLSKTVICKGESATLTAGGANTYSWSASIGNGAATMTMAVSPTLAVLYTYTVNGIDANTCSNTATVQLKVNPCNGIGETNGLANILIYPNPNNGNFKIKADHSLTLKISNELGQELRTLELNTLNGGLVEMKDVAPGIYFVTGSCNGALINERVIVTR